MKKARLVLSDAAAADILEQADWYMAQSGQALALRWEKAVTSAVLRVVKNPGAGTPCTFRPTELRNVRANDNCGISEASALLQNPPDGNARSARRARCPRPGEVVLT